MSVYFIRAGSTNMVKIGFTDRDVESRLRELQTANPEPLKIIRVIPGDEHVEQKYHLRYWQYNKSGEWFDLPENIIQEIEQIEDERHDYHQRPASGDSAFDVRPVCRGQQHQAADGGKNVPEHSWGNHDSGFKRLFATRR